MQAPSIISLGLSASRSSYKPPTCSHTHTYAPADVSFTDWCPCHDKLLQVSRVIFILSLLSIPWCLTIDFSASFFWPLSQYISRVCTFVA
ncbi:hypothetical protein BD414DRAFT_148878 [Trametes punicea]|nr:hypothetical protein BD414DRAFT_148878 [Trametes punicea]